MHCYLLANGFDTWQLFFAQLLNFGGKDELAAKWLVDMEFYWSIFAREFATVFFAKKLMTVILLQLCFLSRAQINQYLSVSWPYQNALYWTHVSNENIGEQITICIYLCHAKN